MPNIQIALDEVPLDDVIAIGLLALKYHRPISFIEAEKIYLVSCKRIRLLPGFRHDEEPDFSDFLRAVMKSLKEYFH
jgi:hypothetical protein